ncbi:serine/threonine-protein kinase Sgk2 [Sugiyamaella lignohabitans]|uniref:Serine/threonine-protein kinase Sgk2 n=1 Tax=Sugiyamaella lignohabitans TaxID=796027 RepID=A0A167DLZ6_9ASCO|nr:serine/threonine-protein kinase Sgk2 [Sugiyamaella lignohabitans]ANB13056.1 serine/threonine-protein kinase Sgk2 [Sugiyamaella lignohabitans]
MAMLVPNFINIGNYNGQLKDKHGSDDNGSQHKSQFEELKRSVVQSSTPQYGNRFKGKQRESDVNADNSHSQNSVNFKELGELPDSDYSHASIRDQTTHLTNGQISSPKLYSSASSMTVYDAGHIYKTKVNNDRALLSTISNCRLRLLLEFLPPLPRNIHIKEVGEAFITAHNHDVIIRMFFNLGYNSPWDGISSKLSFRGTTLQAMLFDYRPDGVLPENILEQIRQIIFLAINNQNYEFWKAVFVFLVLNYHKGESSKLGEFKGDVHAPNGLCTPNTQSADEQLNFNNSNGSILRSDDKFSDDVCSLIDPPSTLSAVKFSLHNELSLHGIIAEVPQMYNIIFHKLDLDGHLNIIMNLMIDNEVFRVFKKSPNVVSMSRKVQNLFTKYSDTRRVSSQFDQIIQKALERMQDLSEDKDFGLFRLWCSESIYFEQHDSQYSDRRDILVPIVFHSKPENRSLDPIKFNLRAVQSILPVVERVFLDQPDRIFVHFATVCNEKLRCYIVDRSRIYEMEAISIVSRPDLFIKAMLEYRLMTREEMGFDNSIQREDDDEYIMFEGHGRLKVLQTLRDKNYGIFGQSTVVRIVQREKDDSVLFLKEYWAEDKTAEVGNSGLYDMERRVYETAMEFNIPFIPKLVGYQELTRTSQLMNFLRINDPSDDEALLHKYFVDLNCDRVQCRYLFEDIAFGQIFNLKQLRDIFKCLVHIVKALKQLYLLNEFTHGDIVSENLLVIQRGAEIEGLLVDFDLSSSRSIEQERVSQIRKSQLLSTENIFENELTDSSSATASSGDSVAQDGRYVDGYQYFPYMSIDRLQSNEGEDIYSFFHDLECLFWVLLLEATRGKDDFFQNWEDLDLSTLIDRKVVIASVECGLYNETTVNEKYVPASGYIYRLQKIVFDTQSRLEMDLSMYDRIIELFDEAAADQYY